MLSLHHRMTLFLRLTVPTIHRTNHDNVLRKAIALLEVSTNTVVLGLRPGPSHAACSDLSECDSLSPPP